MVNYYQVLDVPFWASFEEIKRAYRSRLKLVHPDTSKNSGNEIPILREAYENLSDREKRDSYDQKVRGLFEDTFKIRTVKKDKNRTIKISVEEALSGCIKTIEGKKFNIPALCREIAEHKIEVIASNGVSLEERGLVIDLKINKEQAKKGCAMRVPFIDKPVICRVPEGVRHGEELELRTYKYQIPTKAIAVFVRVLVSLN